MVARNPSPPFSSAIRPQIDHKLLCKLWKEFGEAPRVDSFVEPGPQPLEAHWFVHRGRSLMATMRKGHAPGDVLLEAVLALDFRLGTLSRCGLSAASFDGCNTMEQVCDLYNSFILSLDPRQIDEHFLPSLRGEEFSRGKFIPSYSFRVTSFIFCYFS